MSGVVINKNNGYAGASFPNEGSLFLKRKGQPDGEGRAIICLHGRSGTCLQYQPYYNKFSVGYFANLLALEGFRVFAIDDMGGTDWGSQDSTSRINDAYTYLLNTLAAQGAKVGVMGWSMGGVAALNWIDQNSSKFAGAWLWCPCSDLEWAHSQSTYTAEIDAAYATEGNRTGNSPIATPANYRSLAPIKVCHAQDDATIPYQQSVDFVAAVNDPSVTLKSVATGGHTNLFSGVTDLELVQFFKSAAW